jgi:hypothetical protein
MTPHYSHEGLLFTATAVNAAAIALSLYFIAESVRVASGNFLARLDSDIP